MSTLAQSTRHVALKFQQPSPSISEPIRYQLAKNSPLASSPTEFFLGKGLGFLVSQKGYTFNLTF